MEKYKVLDDLLISNYLSLQEKRNEIVALSQNEVDKLSVDDTIKEKVLEVIVAESTKEVDLKLNILGKYVVEVDPVETENVAENTEVNY